MIAIERVNDISCRGISSRNYRIRSDRGNAENSLFFKIPSRFEGIFSNYDDAMIPLLGVLALVRGEDAYFGEMEADPLLVRNVGSALRQFSQWYPEFRVPKLSGLIASEVKKGAETSGAATFLSGGVDSVFSLIRHTRGNSAGPQSSIESDLSLAVHVFHTPSAHIDFSAADLGQISKIAANRGIDFLPVATNMMTFDRLLNDSWSDVGHGAGLASVFHLLSGGIDTGLIASSHTYGRLMAWGSSPLIDPLWSGNRVRVVHDGSTFTRVEKTELIAKEPVAISGLNVCDNKVKSRGYVNCSSCPKCLRTMVTLDLISNGETGSFSAFDWSAYSPSRLGAIFLRNDSERSFIVEIKNRALDERPDIVRACNQALARSKYLSPIAKIEKAIKNTKFGRKNREALISLRSNIYRTAGWAMRKEADGQAI